MIFNVNLLNFEIIRLADPAGGGNVSGYLSTDYIFDSIKQNKLQDMEKYRFVPCIKCTCSS